MTVHGTEGGGACPHRNVPGQRDPQQRQLQIVLQGCREGAHFQQSQLRQTDSR